MGDFWLNTATGKRFDFSDPKPEDIDIVDIAVALSHQCRYAGHTREHYSVASHSLIIANTLDLLDYPPEVVMWGLLHDAAEAYVTDIPWPLKAAGLVPELSRVEKLIMAVVVAKFGLPETEPPIVKDLDMEILDIEASRLLVRHPDWPVGKPRPARRSLRREFEAHFDRFNGAPFDRGLVPQRVALRFVQVAVHLGLANEGDEQRLHRLQDDGTN